MQGGKIMRKDTLNSLIAQTIGEASLYWEDTKDGVSGGIFDTERAKKLTEKVVNKILEADEPLLGLATTRELIDEIKARLEINGQLDYKTVDD
jgi:hypothetical protein